MTVYLNKRSTYFNLDLYRRQVFYTKTREAPSLNVSHLINSRTERLKAELQSTYEKALDSMNYRAAYETPSYQPKYTRNSSQFQQKSGLSSIKSPVSNANKSPLYSARKSNQGTYLMHSGKIYTSSVTTQNDDSSLNFSNDSGNYSQSGFHFDSSNAFTESPKKITSPPKKVNPYTRTQSNDNYFNDIKRTDLTKKDEEKITILNNDKNSMSNDDNEFVYQEEEEKNDVFNAISSDDDDKEPLSDFKPEHKANVINFNDQQDRVDKKTFDMKVLQITDSDEFIEDEFADEDDSNNKEITENRIEQKFDNGIKPVDNNNEKIMIKPLVIDTDSNDDDYLFEEEEEEEEEVYDHRYNYKIEAPIRKQIIHTEKDDDDDDQQDNDHLHFYENPEEILKPPTRLERIPSEDINAPITKPRPPIDTTGDDILFGRILKRCNSSDGIPQRKQSNFSDSDLQYELYNPVFSDEESENDNQPKKIVKLPKEEKKFTAEEIKKKLELSDSDMINFVEEEEEEEIDQNNSVIIISDGENEDPLKTPTKSTFVAIDMEINEDERVMYSSDSNEQDSFDKEMQILNSSSESDEEKADLGLDFYHENAQLAFTRNFMPLSLFESQIHVIFPLADRIFKETLDTVL